MWIEQTYPSPRLRDFVSSIVAIAAGDLGISAPEIVFFRPWTNLAELPWKELPDGEGVGGFAQRGYHRIALKTDRNIDVLTHVALHEVRHLVTSGKPGYEGAAGELDACTWADGFQARHFDEMLRVFQSTGVDHGEYSGTRDHNCVGCALAAEVR